MKKKRSIALLYIQVTLLAAVVGWLLLKPARASVLAEVQRLEAHKTAGAPQNQAQPAPRQTPVMWRLPDGSQVNLRNYKIVLFMQSGCQYCHQFDPLLKSLSERMGLSVFAYTLDGRGDASFPDAIPAPSAVIQDLFSTMKPVTPAAFLVEVNTLRTLPLLYGMVDAGTLSQRVNEALILSEQTRAQTQYKGK
ncbi:type-F conjugative transfer system pilin assembly thiol-disulfide isomerase TrbB [Salmonella enterica]|uniref:type-F conjugative transfer system pilin assembly thiol-disulfide isomerase TrbB n=1 Tax=Citrobacter freundii TaxID=546 RepID=UPI0020973B5D|nr:type-F conjugative transfer system pilin assembly thiol-disulfide isomerase TrbB [Citrobacter freundii]EIA4658327.1 type-F conjugative transfer system pilin assembly thiol-disulfide isomerase TrbB [Salmonella enterica]ELU8076033.1 type-F conjugative transfer system pilin assembly thiol-disulfide isomerase TrbB [Salmonella enterica]MEB6855226.1 type-F conjugative transfer system pilin assembly thiol-disulfide isomerase TrbB [Escherichia coli]URZ94158.1 type-F conjugative transfer system pilin